MKKRIFYFISLVVIIFEVLIIQDLKTYAFTQPLTYDENKDMYGGILECYSDCEEYSKYLTLPSGAKIMNLHYDFGETIRKVFLPKTISWDIEFNLNQLLVDNNLDINEVSSVNIQFMFESIYDEYYPIKDLLYHYDGKTERLIIDEFNNDFLFININPNKEIHNIKIIPEYYQATDIINRKIINAMFIPVVEIYMKSDDTVIHNVTELDNVLKDNYENYGRLNVIKTDTSYDLQFYAISNVYIWNNLNLPSDIEQEDINYAKWVRSEYNNQNYYILEFSLKDGSTLIWNLNDEEYEKVNVVTITSDECEKRNKYEIYIHFNTDVPMDDIYMMKVSYTDYYTFGAFDMFENANWIQGSEKTHERIIKSDETYDISHGLLDWYTSGLFGKKGQVNAIEHSDKENYDWKIFLGDMNQTELWYKRDSWIQEAVSSMIRPSDYFIKDYVVLKFWYSYKGVAYVSDEVIDVPLADDTTKELSDVQKAMLNTENKINNIVNHPVVNFIIDNLDVIVIIIVLLILLSVLSPVLTLLPVILKSVSLLIKVVFSILLLPLNIVSSSSKKHNHYKKFRKM
ncbi:hypothetical protein KHQ81_10880 [Mycoplasmatota bacterium]|nr:hypothetical protein KHQ81_10880 [Mycoplasmatota bacterium]